MLVKVGLRDLDVKGSHGVHAPWPPRSEDKVKVLRAATFLWLLTDGVFMTTTWPGPKRIGWTATAGRYTMRVLIDANYYDEPPKYHSPSVKYYKHPQILLGTPQPPFIDRNRLNILTALLSLSVLITLRPRRAPKTEQGPRRVFDPMSI